MLKKLFKKKTTVENTTNAPVFEETNKILKLGYMVVIVDKYLEDSIRSILKKGGASAVFVKHGIGTATKDIYESLHLVEQSKAILFTLVTEEKYYHLKELVIEKLNTSKFAKGLILYKILSSIGGVSNYKFFAQHDYVKEVK